MPYHAPRGRVRSRCTTHLPIPPVPLLSITVQGVALRIPVGITNPRLKEALESGRYEDQLARAVQKLLRPDDVYFELGAGIGFLSTLAARIVRDEARIHAFEANPQLIPIIKRTWRTNEVAGNVYNCILGAGPRDERDFNVASAFWASSADIAYPKNKTIKVPQRDFLQQMDKKAATFLVVDIEGGERDVLDKVLSPVVRVVVAHYHARIIGQEMVDALWRHLEEQGFREVPELTGGLVKAYVRG